MNLGTKIRTVVAIICAINIALITFGIFSFENSMIDIIYRIASVGAMIIAWIASHYYNNDYSPEHAEQTGLARLRKKSRKNIVGEDFFDNYIEDIIIGEGEEDELNA